MKLDFWRRLIFLVLLILPFFWFKPELYSLGEDDTGIAYLQAEGALNQSLSSWYSSDHIPRFEQFAGHTLVFNTLLTVLKKITFSRVNLQQLAWGFLMSFSFLYIVRILELLFRRKSPAFYLAGLFYSLAPYFFIVEYYFLMPSAYAIVLAPVVFYYYFFALKVNSNVPLLKGAIWTFLLSRALTTPAFINFLSFFALFFFVWSYINLSKPNFKKALKRLIVYGLLVVLINTILVLPTVFSLCFDNNSAFQQTYRSRNETSYLNNMLSYTHSEIAQNRYIYYLTNYFPETISRLQDFRNYGFYAAYLDHFLVFSLSFSFFIFLGLRDKLNTGRKEVLPFLSLFLISLLFLSVNLVDIFRQLYDFLMLKTSIFNMNRIPSMKFHLSYLFYFALLAGLSLENLLLRRFRHVVRLFVFYGFFAIVLPSFIFLNGRFFRDEIPQGWTKAMKFDQNYLDTAEYVRTKLRDDTRLLLFPLGYGFGSFIPGSESNQTYRAMTTGFKKFAGFNLFGNLKILRLQGDSSISQLASDYFYLRDLKALYTLSKKLNTKYILYIKNIKHLKSFGEIIPVYTYKSPSYFAPVKKETPVYNNAGFSLYKIRNYNNLSQISTANKQTSLSFKKIADFMYLLKIKTVAEDNLSFQELFSPGWYLYPINSQEFECRSPLNLAKDFPNLTECLHQNNNWLGNLKLMKFFFQKHLDYPHGIYDNYANVWKIDTKGTTQYYALIFGWQKMYTLAAITSALILLLYLIIIYRQHDKSKK